MGRFTRLDLLLSGDHVLAYRERRREELAPILGEGLATRTIAMMIAYNSLYYGVMVAFVVTVWAEFTTGSVPATVATVAWLAAGGLVVRRAVWRHRIGRETWAYGGRYQFLRWLEGAFAVGFGLASLFAAVRIFRADNSEDRAGGVIMTLLLSFGAYITWRIAREAQRELRDIAQTSARSGHRKPPASSSRHVP